LRTINDIDVACYISGADTPQDVPALMNYLAERLRRPASPATLAQRPTLN
jgi:hypothetical protein